MYSNCTNAVIHCTVYEEKKVLLTIKIMFELELLSVLIIQNQCFQSIIFWPCCWAVENLCCADLQCLSFADLVVQTHASSAL